ncbi:MAG: hypothetical protein ACOC2F_06070 [Bacteroidota bacterium]
MTNLQVSFNNHSISISIPKEINSLVHQNIFSEVISDSHDDQVDFSVLHKSNIYHLFYQDQEIYTTDNPHELVYTLEWNIVDELIRMSTGVFQIHGATLNHRDKSYLFIGEPGSGKTSLAILLSKLGMNLLSDEVSLVNWHNYNAYPFPRNLIIKQHLLDLISIPAAQQPLLIEADDNQREQAFFLPISHFASNNQLSVNRVGKIFFLDPVNDIEFNIQLIGEHQAFNRMTPQVFNVGELQNYHEKIIHLIMEIPTFTLKIGKPLLLSDMQQQKLLDKILNEVN